MHIVLFPSFLCVLFGLVVFGRKSAKPAMYHPSMSSFEFHALNGGCKMNTVFGLCLNVTHIYLDNIKEAI